MLKARGRPQVQKTADSIDYVSATLKPSFPLGNTVAIPKERDAFHQEKEDLIGHCSGLFACHGCQRCKPGHKSGVI